MNDQILPGGLGGVGSGFVAPESTYSNAALLYGAYSGLVDTTPTTYSSASTLYGPSMGVPAAPTQLAGQVFSAQFPDALPGALVAGPGAGEIPLDAAIRGYRGGYAGVLDPSPTAAYAGKLVGEAAQSFKNFGYQLAGAASADAARAAWNNGNYGVAVAKEAQAFGEAALTLTGAGAVGRAAAPAARATAASVAESADIVIDKIATRLGWRLGITEGGGTYSGAKFGLATSNDYRATFFAANPGLEGQVVVHHAVEQQVLTRYPGTVSASEMHSLENLRGIPKTVNWELHLSQIRREWNQFYRSNPNATQQQLLQKATEIDMKYGNQFNPPVNR
ncbi:hypothetical protein [Burkholderia stagnalis]|uniref:hypothetical protein n=1 Tax=Burkholderia stagnalis TaxID=1503054 RepID=UPI000F59556B|nr:hypothetical protein [Burkholderia stagnalis]